MPILRPVFTAIAIALLTTSLAGCGSVSSFLAGSMGDYIPAWAGGLPAGAPPRPGTPQYDEWVKQHEPGAGAAVAAQPPEPQATAPSVTDAVH